MTAKELREKFIKFFEEKGHKHLSGSSLIPKDDPSVLLTTAGMQQFKKWFSGIEKPQFSKVVTIQKCVRIDDIEEVGDDTHLSFFEMAGNFSFNDYFKKEAIEWGIEFIKELGVSDDRISFTYFKSDKEIPEDKESLEILKNLKISPQKIKAMGKEDNFWGPTGDEGPCGPTVEIYVDGIEVWNLVFNQYYRTKDGKYENLKTPGVDTGLGFERMLTILENKKNLYETELFLPTLNKISDIGGVKRDRIIQNYERIIADHLRAATFLLADGVLPSNLDKGYVLRRLIRRAIRYGKLVAIENKFIAQITEVIINNYKDTYLELEKNKNQIIEELNKEEEKFSKTLEKGLKYINDNIDSWKKFPGMKFIGGFSFYAFETYGFPPEMTLEEIKKHKKVVKQLNEKDFWNHFYRRYREHQEKSRKGAEKKFKGGLATGGEVEIKYHTATHLLQQALRIILGDHIKQAGSNITSERLRFDFTHPEKLTLEQIEEVENLVNEQIKAKLEVKCEEMSVEDAKKEGATGLFEEKYGDKVKVYSIGNFSKEICGGPHVKNTSELGNFKIIKEEASSAGVRRIKAILE